MGNYVYKCFSCKKEFTAGEIERNFVYLCPDCGNAEKNKPLEGVLTVEYDYKKIKSKLDREEFLKLPTGKFWLYPGLWPVDFSRINNRLLQRLALPADQLYEYELKGKKVLIQDETRNPTLSYKDRASSLVALKAIELGITEIAAASTGNAGSSLAGICARLGLKSRIYVPQNIPESKRIQIEAYGAKLEIVNGDYDLAFDKCLEDSTANSWYNRNTAYNPLTIEGKKSAAFDIFISTQGNIPQYIFVPVGDGVIISGIYKGFKELQTLGWIGKLPQLIAVQSEKSNAVVRYLETGTFKYKPANTRADSISAGAPRNLYMAAGAVKASGGYAVSVSDEEILSAQNEFIEQTGILCEPSSAAVYAAFRNNLLKNSLLLITGNGLKDLDTLKSL